MPVPEISSYEYKTVKNVDALPRQRLAVFLFTNWFDFHQFLSLELVTFPEFFFGQFPFFNSIKQIGLII